MPLFSPFSGILRASFCLFILFTSTIFAQSANQWRALAPIEGGVVNALVEHGGRIYAGTNLRGVFVSSDSGKTWRVTNNGLVNLTILSLAASGENVLAATNAGIYRSGDGGQSWTLAGANTVGMRAFAKGGAGIFVAGSTGRVFRSTDDGQSWGMRGTIPNNTLINALTFQGENLFAGTSRGVFRSTDQGQTWAGVNSGLPNNEEPFVFALAVNGNDLYMGTSVYGDGANSLPQVYTTSNSGQSWSPVGETIRIQLSPNASGVSSIIGLYVDGPNLYALTVFGLSVYEGSMWNEPVGIRGLPAGIRANTLTRAGGTLMLGTQGGIF